MGLDLAAAVRSTLTTMPADELAYFALTGKPEIPFRDRLAFELQTAAREGITVPRDYRRVDIAMLRADQSAAAVIELKSAYSFDALLPAKQPSLVATVQAEIDRCKASTPPKQQCFSFCVLGLIHPLDRIPTSLYRTVKSAAEINRILDPFVDTAALAATAGRFVSQTFTDRHGHVREIASKVGTAFEIKVETYWFVVELGTPA